MKAERRARRFWIWGFFFLFLAHAAAIFRFSERNPLAPWRPTVQMEVLPAVMPERVTLFLPAEVGGDPVAVADSAIRFLRGIVSRK